MTNVQSKVIEIAPIGGTSNAGWKLGYINSVTKAAQNDTVTLGNARAVEWAVLTIDADGTEEAVTLATNVITLTDATAGAVSGLVAYR